MSDMLQIAQSGALAYSRALDIVADNVANVSTPGYVRRNASLATAPAGGAVGPLERDPVGGNGVRMDAVGRAIDALQTDTLRRAEGDVAALDTAQRWLRATQSTLTGPSSIDGPYTAFVDSLSALTADPTDPGLRQIFLLSADGLADRFNSAAAELQDLQSNLRAEAQNEAQNLTALAQNLAALNGQLRRATDGGAARATLLDQQDRILAEMATITAIDVQYDHFGQALVRLPDAGGPTLVDGQTAQHARITQTGAGFELRIGRAGADELAPTPGGVFAGLSTAAQKIAEAQTRLDDLASQLANDFNAAHQNGVDLNGNDGGALFSTTLPQVTGDAANAGNARVTAVLAPGAALQDSRLIFDGSDWTLANAGGSVTGPLPLTLDGLTVEAAGAGITGDVYRISATRQAAALTVDPLNTDQLALATRWNIEPSQLNTGSATLEVKLDASATTTGTPPFTVSVLADGSLALFDSIDPTTPIAAAAAGDWLMGDGFTVRLNGDAAAGDSFEVLRAGAGEGSNGNARALLALRDLAGTSGTFGDALDSLRSTITTGVAETSRRLELATARRDGAAEALQRKSGVDLNTEAAEMLRLQQAFQANARVIQASREIFDTILSATR